MDAMAPTHPLVQKDMNVEVIKGLSLPLEKKSRSVWAEKHRLALLLLRRVGLAFL